MLLLFAALLFTFQQAELTGTILDPAGNTVPNVSLSLSDLETNAAYRAVTGNDGRYLLLAIKPGRYMLTAEVAGFQRFIRTPLTLSTGEKVRLDVSLMIGSVNESVTVSLDAPLLRTESANLGQVIDDRKIVDLPLNGRSFVSLVALSPGVALPQGSAFPRINGGRPRTNEYLFDGVTVLQPEPGQVAFIPIIDAIQEFKIETNSPGAEFGRFNGGVINLTSKSGTNELHGTVFEFLRNEIFNARNLFAPATSTSPGKPLFRRNQFGAVAGGPISRDRTFFFAGYQGTRQAIARVRTSTVPTLLQRQGIFTESIGGNVPGIVVPRDRMDPFSLRLLERYPIPTSGGTANNYRRIGIERQNQNQADARIDHRFGLSDSVFLRYSQARDTLDPVTPLPDGSGNLTAGALGKTNTSGQSLALNHVHILGGASANDFRFGYSRRTLTRDALRLPTYTIDGYQQLGPPANAFSESRTDVTHLLDTVSMQKGRHFIKAGFDLRRSRMDIVQTPSPLGSYRFTATQSGFSLASFLLGAVDGFSIDKQERPLRPRAHSLEYFVQDDWKATSRLALTAGLRYTLNFPSTEVDDQGAVFNLATGKLDFLGKDGVSRSARRLHMLNFGPRVGLAYQASNRMVVRIGYGLIWIEQAGITSPFTNPQFPFVQTIAQRSLDGVAPAFTLSAGPAVSAPPLSADSGLGQGVFTVDRDLGSGYAQQWNLSVQRELAANLVFEAAYTGSKITHVGIPDSNLNQLTAAQLQLGAALLERVPNPFFGVIPRASSLGDPTITRAHLLKPFPHFTTVSFFRNNVGSTNYHAIQARLEKRFSRGFSMLASYTRSKLIDDASAVFDAAIVTGPAADFPVADSFNRRLERDVSSGDMPNVFASSAIYDLPGGWRISAVLSLQSGLPLSVTQNTNFNAFAGFGTQRPNRLREPNLPGRSRSTDRFFDTGAFAAAPQFTIGNSSRNPVRGPAVRNLDLALTKSLKIRDRLTAELRAELFNVTNTPPLGNPNAVFGAPGFGSISSAGDPRVAQLAVKMLF